MPHLNTQIHNKLAANVIVFEDQNDREWNGEIKEWKQKKMVHCFVLAKPLLF